MAGSPKKRAKRGKGPGRTPYGACRALMVIAQPPVDEEHVDRFGKRTKFKPEFIEIARVLCEEGATDKELATYLDIHLSTLYEWRNTIPAFGAVMKLGKDIANDRLERTAYDVACGYTTTVKVNVKVKAADGSEKMMEVNQEVRVSPSEKLLMWMLMNRRPDDWKMKTESTVTHEVTLLTPAQARERLKAKIEELKLTDESRQAAAG